MPPTATGGTGRRGGGDPVLINSKRKGKVGELRIAKALRNLFPGCEARRGVQYAGGTDSPDVLIPSVAESLHIEVKCGKQVPKWLYKVMDQAHDDGGSKCCVAIVQGHCREPVVIVALEDLLAMVEVVNRLVAERIELEDKLPKL